MDEEEKEVNVYGDEARESLEENDEISPEEEAFMKGYEEDEDADDDIDDPEYEEVFEEAT